MQLNYSRAFGGKDLKMFGLSSEPTVLQLLFRAGQEAKAQDEADVFFGPVKCLIIGSDGVWDVVEPTAGVGVVTQARAAFAEFSATNSVSLSTPLSSRVASPSEELVRVALENHVLKRSSDNVTAVVLFFD